MNESEIFSTRIKLLRESLGMTQMDFSDFIGMTQQALSAYERRKISPSLEILTKIAKKCDISIDWLCGLSDNKILNISFNTYCDIADLLFQISGITKMRLGIDPDANSPYITFDTKILCDFLNEWNDASNILKSSSINKKITKTMFDAWKKNKLEELDKIPVREEQQN